MGAKKNCLIEMVLLSTHNMFWLRNMKKKLFGYALLTKGLTIGRKAEKKENLHFYSYPSV